MFISNDDIKFAKSTFSDFVNGQMHSPKVVAGQMAREHRYLQNEMFKICYEYIRILAMKFEHHQYDDRNELACKIAYDMLINSKHDYLAISSYEWENYCELDNNLYKHNL